MKARVMASIHVIALDFYLTKPKSRIVFDVSKEVNANEDKSALVV